MKKIIIALSLPLLAVMDSERVGLRLYIEPLILTVLPYRNGTRPEIQSGAG